MSPLQTSERTPLAGIRVSLASIIASHLLSLSVRGGKRLLYDAQKLRKSNRIKFIKRLLEAAPSMMTPGVIDDSSSGNDSIYTHSGTLR